MTKKLWALILVCAMAALLCACDTSTVSSPIASAGSAASMDAASTQAGATEAAQVSIQSTTLVDQDGLVITTSGLTDDSLFGMGVKVLVENNTDQNLVVQCGSLVVNNYMITGLFSCSVAAGKKANDVIDLSWSELEAAGITTLSDIAIKFHVYNDDTFDTLFDTDEVEIKTSAYGTVTQPALDDGQELYNQGGVRIVGRYVDENSFWGAGILLYIENTSGKDVIIQCDDLSVNGFMMTPYFSCTVNNGRMALNSITLLSSDLEQNGIKKIETVELVFKVLDPATYQTLVQTDPITFQMN